MASVPWSAIMASVTARVRDKGDKVRSRHRAGCYHLAEVDGAGELLDRRGTPEIIEGTHESRPVCHRDPEDDAGRR